MKYSLQKNKNWYKYKTKILRKKGEKYHWNKIQYTVYIEIIIIFTTKVVEFCLYILRKKVT